MKSVEAFAGTATQLSSSLSSVLLPFLPFYRCQCQRHFLTNSMHAIVQLRVCFLGSLTCQQRDCSGPNVSLRVYVMETQSPVQQCREVRPNPRPLGQDGCVLKNGLMLSRQWVSHLEVQREGKEESRIGQKEELGRSLDGGLSQAYSGL